MSSRNRNDVFWVRIDFPDRLRRKGSQRGDRKAKESNWGGSLQPDANALPPRRGHSSTGSPCLFQGRRWDDGADLYYFRNRVMSSVLGRFLQRDPKGFAGHMNPYDCVSNSPPNLVDP